jgi:rare lipoprotein A (peptidoglycan hydrolase)
MKEVDLAMRPMHMSARGALALGATALATTLAGLPATAQSDSQGTAATQAATTTPTTTAPVPATAAAAPVRTRFKVRSARRNVVVRRAVVVRGTLRPGQAGKRVRLQVRRGHGWRTVATTRSRRGGTFRVRYTPKRIGVYRYRVAFRGDRAARRSNRSIGTFNVYRKVLASWYGGGGAVACAGYSMGSGLGVAHRTLPCGTKVKLRYRGRTVVARVIDRGPFVSGREYDLTAATKNALRAGDLTTIMATR